MTYDRGLSLNGAEMTKACLLQQIYEGDRKAANDCWQERMRKTKMAVGTSKTKMHGLFEVPNCVSALGLSHSF